MHCVNILFYYEILTKCSGPVLQEQTDALIVKQFSCNKLFLSLILLNWPASLFMSDRWTYKTHIHSKWDCQSQRDRKKAKKF